MDGECIMFSWDEIFGTRNKDGSWDLEITGTETESDGSSWERTVTIKGANIEIEMAIGDAPNFRVNGGSGYITEHTTFH